MKANKMRSETESRPLSGNNGFTEYLKSQGMAYSSIATGQKIIKLYAQWLKRQRLQATETSYGDLLRYVQSLKRKGTSQRTTQHYVSFIKHYYDHLVQAGETVKNPTDGIEIKGIKRKTLYKIMEPNELNALYNQFKGDTARKKRDRAMLGLYIYQGLKTEELGKLEVKDIQLREGTAEIQGGKRSNGRTLKLEAHQVLDLYDYILQARPMLLALPPKHKHQKPQATEKLIVGDSGSSDINNMATQLMIQLRKLNPKAINAKHLRASVITKWVKAHNLREAQYKAGHRYVSTTESYLQNDMEGLKEEVNQYHPLG